MLWPKRVLHSLSLSETKTIPSKYLNTMSLCYSWRNIDPEESSWPISHLKHQISYLASMEKGQISVEMSHTSNFVLDNNRPETYSWCQWNVICTVCPRSSDLQNKMGHFFLDTQYLMFYNKWIRTCTHYAWPDPLVERIPCPVVAAGWLAGAPLQSSLPYTAAYTAQTCSPSSHGTCWT